MWSSASCEAIHALKQLSMLPDAEMGSLTCIGDAKPKGMMPDLQSMREFFMEEKVLCTTNLLTAKQKLQRVGALCGVALPHRASIAVSMDI